MCNSSVLFYYIIVSIRAVATCNHGPFWWALIRTCNCLQLYRIAIVVICSYGCLDDLNIIILCMCDMYDRRIHNIPLIIASVTYIIVGLIYGIDIIMILDIL